MSIFDSIAKAFGPKATKAPTVANIERLRREATEGLEAARLALETLEVGRLAAVVEGEAAHAAHHAKIAGAREALERATDAHAAIVARLADARADAEERSRREVYDRARAAQRAAADALEAEYGAARDTLLRLQRLAAEADELVATANADLPADTLPLERETESLVRDLPGHQREVVRSETVELWCGEHGQPIADQQSVRRTGASTGVIYSASSLGDRAVQVHLRTFRRMTVRPWQAPTFGERLADLNIPPLQPDAPLAAKEVEELEPITQLAVAAE